MCGPYLVALFGKVMDTFGGGTWRLQSERTQTGHPDGTVTQVSPNAISKAPKRDADFTITI